MVEHAEAVIENEIVENAASAPVDNNVLPIVMHGLSALVGIVSSVYYGRMAYTLFKARNGGEAQ